MRPDQEPIPHEDVPPGWGPVANEDDRVVYRRHDSNLELEIARTNADRSHPALGLGRCWELRLRHLVGEQPVTEHVGRVSTRGAALDGLRRSMERVHQQVDDTSDPLAVLAAIEQLALDDHVPERPQAGER